MYGPKLTIGRAVCRSKDPRTGKDGWKARSKESRTGLEGLRSQKGSRLRVGGLYGTVRAQVEGWKVARHRKGLISRLEGYKSQ